MDNSNEKDFHAIVGLDSTNFLGVSELADSVETNMTKNSATFPEPDPALSTITTENSKLKTLITEARSGDHQKIQARDEQSVVVYNLLRRETIYVNKVAKGDRAIVLLSGFEASKEREPQPIPGKAVINKVEKGKTPLSAKIYIKPMGRDLIYIVKSRKVKSEDKKYDIVLITKNSKKLIVENLERGEEYLFIVAAKSTSGQGSWSEPCPFFPS